MIKGLNHAGIVVNDLEESIHFYSNVVGLPVDRMIERSGEPISSVVGYEDVHIKAALLDLGDGHFLELIQYFNPVAVERPTEERAVLGGSHLAFTVDNIEETLIYLNKNGARILNVPVEVVPGRFVCYMRDPDNNWIELIEDSTLG